MLSVGAINAEKPPLNICVHTEKRCRGNRKRDSTRLLPTSDHRLLLSGLRITIQTNGIRYLGVPRGSFKIKKTETNLPYNNEDLEQRFEEFVEETNKKINELELVIRYLKKEISIGKKETLNIVNVNEGLKNSFGSTIKTIGDIVNRKNPRS